MGTDFVIQVKFTIFWLNRGLRVYLDLYASDFPKSTSQYFLHPSTFKSQTPCERNHPNDVKYILAEKEESFDKTFLFFEQNLFYTIGVVSLTKNPPKIGC